MPARRRDCETSQASAERTILLSLAAFGWTIAFTGCPEVAEHLESILYGWRLRRPSSPTWTPDAHVRRTKAGFVWRSAVMAKPELWDAHPPVSAMQAVCDVHDVLFDWFLAANPRHLCLHAAAVRIGESLICFPSVQRAGKSTLCVALAARGHTLYCDDVLPVEPKHDFGVALGIAPRLRKPLPRSFGANLSRFVARRARPSDRRWTYVNLGPGEIAPLGESAPIRAFVLLQRGASRARFEVVSRSAMLEEILLQNFARKLPPVEILDRLMRLTGRVPCYRLHYGSISGAARLLEQTFSGKQPPGVRKPKVPIEREQDTPRGVRTRKSGAAARRRGLTGRFRRAPGVAAREVAGEFFVAARGPKTIHHLDRTASAAWRALAAPKSADELVALFAVAFPDTPKRKLVSDVTRLLAFLKEAGVIVPADTARRRKQARRGR
jgi:hypothetical protein